MPGMHVSITPSPQIRDQQAFYDARWAGEPFVNRLKLARAVAILEALGRLRLKEPRILDLGCGTGWLTGMLGQCGPTTGVDLSEVAVERARSRFPYVTFLAHDLSQGQVVGTFDIVVSQEVIEHLEDQAAHIALIAKMLRPGGWLLMTTPNGRYEQDGGQPIEHHLRANELRELLQPAIVVRELRSVILPHRWHRFVSSSPAAIHFLESCRLGKHLFVVAQRA